MSGHHCGLSFPGLCLDRPKSATTLSAKLAKKYLGITTTSLAEHVLCGPEHVHKYTFKQDPEEANMRLLYLQWFLSVMYITTHVELQLYMCRNRSLMYDKC